MAASMFMNSNSLPIALMQSLVVTVPNLKWDEDDTQNAMLGRALSYLVLYSTLGMVLRWSYGVHLLQQADPETLNLPLPASSREPYTDNPEHASILVQVDDVDVSSPQPSNDSQPSITFEEYTRRDSRRLRTSYDQDENAGLNVRQQKRPQPKDFLSFPNTPISSAITLKQDSGGSGSSTTTLNNDDVHNGRHAHTHCDSDSDESDSEPLLVHTRHPQPHPSSSSLKPKFKRLFRRTWRHTKRTLKAFNAFMTVPLWAAALSLVVALTPSLQHTLDVHLQPIKGALSAAGNCSIPLTLVVLGAYFYRSPEAPSPAKHVETSLNSNPDPEF